MDRATREVWTERIERWKESGLSAKEFATPLGIKPRTLRWWHWNLGTSAVRKGPRRRSAAKSGAIVERPSTAMSPLAFVEMTASVLSEPLEVVLPSTFRVRVPTGFDDATLVRLLDVLERR
jgi:transposase